MIVLDTNVISELARPAPLCQVSVWLAQQPTDGVYVTSVTEAELRYGLAIMPAGRRRSDLVDRINRLFGNVFLGHVLPFDHDAAPHYAALMAHRRELGRPIATADAMIAAIALANGCKLATRNVTDFEDTGVEVVDPFSRT